jgi:hypothetical protein
MTSIRIASIRIAFAAALAAILFAGGTAHAGHRAAPATHTAVLTAMGPSSSSPVLCCDSK